MLKYFPALFVNLFGLGQSLISEVRNKNEKYSSMNNLKKHHSNDELVYMQRRIFFRWRKRQRNNSVG